MQKIIYETGCVSPNVLGSGESHTNVITTTDETKAFAAYRNGRDYLYRITYDGSRKTEVWDNEKKGWGD